MWVDRPGLCIDFVTEYHSDRPGLCLHIDLVYVQHRPGLYIDHVPEYGPKTLVCKTAHKTQL